jgi:hypothetical protein
MYINDLPPTINTLSKPILFTDDTTVIISGNNFYDFCAMSNTLLSHMSKWFTSNKLVLNLDKTTIIKSVTNKSSQYNLNVGYDEKNIEESINIKFFGLQTDNSLNWKLNRACHAIRLMSHLSSTNILKSIYLPIFIQ